MEAFKECGVCFQSYDTSEHSPRSLNCGHTLCSKCLARIVSNYDLRRCPFDQRIFNDSQSSLNSFPPNFAVLAYLEQKNSNLCKIHPEKKLKWMCLTEKVKICSKCAKSEDHKEHRKKKIKELREHGGKIKEQFEDACLRIKHFEENEEKEYEQIKKVLVSTIDGEFRKIQNILVKKKIECVQQANNLFNTDQGSSHPAESLFALKQQMQETINDINYACKNDKNLMILDKDFNSEEIIEKSKSLVDKATQIYQKALEMNKLFQESLDSSKMKIDSLQIPSKEFLKEIHSEEEIGKIHSQINRVKFQSFFEMKRGEEGLEISTGGAEAKEFEVNIGDFQTAETIKINLRRYDTLKNEPTPSLLCYMMSGLEKWTSLDLSFVPNGFNNDPVFWIGRIVSGYVEHLDSLYIDLQNCKITNQPIKTLCDLILSRGLNLQSLYLYLDSSKMVDSDVDVLANTIKPFAKNLKIFTLGLTNSKLTSDGFKKMFQVIKDMESLTDLELVLSKTNLLDENLKLFGNDVLPNLKALESLSLCLNKCKIKDEGVLSVFESLPNLKTLKLYLCYTGVTEETGQEFSQNVLPSLKSCLESLTFAARETKISKWEIERIRDFSEKLKGQKKKETSLYRDSYDSVSCSDESDSIYNNW